MLDGGHGKAVGYILGTTDTAGLVKTWIPQYLATIELELSRVPPPGALTGQEQDELAERRDTLLYLIRNDPHSLVYSEYASQLKPWPGHFHIDILPSHQRQGYGKMLINAFRDAAKAQGCTGAYLGMGGSNYDAARFYEACGFRRLPHVLDDGLSGEMGRTRKRADGGETVYYVIEF